MRQMMLIVGAAVELAVLWFRAEKKLTVDFAGLWGILGGTSYSNRGSVLFFRLGQDIF